MEKWLEKWLHMSVDEAALALAVLAFLLSMLLPPVRRTLGRARRWAALILGFSRRRHRRAFLREHGTLHNIYLDREERLDLGGTYVSLSFFSAEQGQEDRVLANRVLANTEIRRFLIVGDPGTGKSTLLKAYGTGILRGRTHSAGLQGRSDLRAISGSKEVPFFVPLRQFAKRADGSADSLRTYLVEGIAGRQPSRQPSQPRLRAAESFFDRTVRRGRALVLLDGLDEVPETRYGDVRDAIQAFVTDTADGDEPDSGPRVVMSCRRQNFLRIRDDWIPVFARQTHAIAPLRDTEILRFLDKRRTEFTGNRSPDAFLKDIKASPTADLHRIPLILTISLALYLQLPAYKIPGSIARFYENMIRQLLVRHDFSGDGGRAQRGNVFDDEDKYWFLREFALAVTKRPSRFEDFRYDEIVEEASKLVPRMTNVRDDQVHAFIREIIDRSGLLTRISDVDEYIFAHRSIHEYLAAVQLARDPTEGAAFLWDRVGDDAWRQVCLFFTAVDHKYVDGFLSGLAERSAEVAGHCLATAVRVTTPVALGVLEHLRGDAIVPRAGNRSLAALMAATRAPKDDVRTAAVSALHVVLRSLAGHPDHLTELFGADAEGLVRLLDALAGTGAPEIVAMVPTLTTMVPDSEPRLVAPLWNCLAVPGVNEVGETAAVLVRKLLRMATDPACFVELQEQPAYRPAFDTEDLRLRAYPFNRGVDRDSNLVTLLAWNSHLGVNLEPNPPNRFIEASAHTTEFAAVEKNHFRRWTAVEPYKYMLPVSTITTLAAVVSCLGILAASGPVGFEVAHLGWWSIFPAVGPAVLSLIGFGLFELFGNRFEFFGTVDRVPNIFARLGHFIKNLSEILAAPYVLLVELVLAPSSFALAFAPLSSGLGLPVYLVIIFLVQLLFYWSSEGEWCEKGCRIRLRKSRPFEDVYDDPRSRHWLGLETPA